MTREHVRMPHLISPQELAEYLRALRPVCLLDVRWRLDQPEGRPAYLEGHLPGAVYVDLDGELADRADPGKGRHPLPSREQLEESARRWGVNRGDVVVAYDDLGSVAAARAWWLLSRAGVDVRVLDGGLRGWLAEGLPVEIGDVQTERGDVELSDPEGGVIDIDEATDWSRHGVLIDVRAPERYRGETEPLDPVAGHIPGAVNLPTGAQTEAGKFRSADEIRAVFASVGVTPGAEVAAYCGSGIAATHTALAGAVVGIDVAVFPGSWSQWSRTRGRHVATGATPSREVAPL